MSSVRPPGQTLPPAAAVLGARVPLSVCKLPCLIPCFNASDCVWVGVCLPLRRELLCFTGRVPHPLPARHLPSAPHRAGIGPVVTEDAGRSCGREGRVSGGMAAHRDKQLRQRGRPGSSLTSEADTDTGQGCGGI